MNPKPRAPERLPQISDAEWIVMKVLWNRAPLSTNEVVEALEQRTRWKPKTIHTLLSRLVRKKALLVDRRGRQYQFRPRVAEEACLQAVSRSFLGRVFNGKLAPFLACFLERERLSPAEIDELKRLLDEKKPRN